MVPLVRNWGAGAGGVPMRGGAVLCRSRFRLAFQAEFRGLGDMPVPQIAWNGAEFDNGPLGGRGPAVASLFGSRGLYVGLGAQSLAATRGLATRYDFLGAPEDLSDNRAVPGSAVPAALSRTVFSGDFSAGAAAGGPLSAFARFGVSFGRLLAPRWGDNGPAAHPDVPAGRWALEVSGEVYSAAEWAKESPDYGFDPAARWGEGWKVARVEDVDADGRVPSGSYGDSASAEAELRFGGYLLSENARHRVGTWPPNAFPLRLGGWSGGVAGIASADASLPGADWLLPTARAIAEATVVTVTVADAEPVT